MGKIREATVIATVLMLVFAGRDARAQATAAPQPAFEAACAAEIEADARAMPAMRDWELNFYRDQFTNWSDMGEDSLREMAKGGTGSPSDLVRACAARFVLAQRSAEESAKPPPKEEVAEARPETSERDKPEMEASTCLKPQDPARTLYGGFINSCPYEVNFYFCNVDSPKDSSSAAFDCAQKKGAVATVPGVKPPKTEEKVTLHTREAATTWWAGCKAPAGPHDVKYTKGQGLEFSCR